jgi:hypothetical protein
MGLTQSQTSLDTSVTEAPPDSTSIDSAMMSSISSLTSLEEKPQVKVAKDSGVNEGAVNDRWIP